MHFAPRPTAPAVGSTGRRPGPLAGAAIGALAAGLILAGALPAQAHGKPAPNPTPAPAVTRAGLDPALSAGRGADVPFVEQEAEHAETNGEVLAPTRDAYTLAGEASGRSAVKLLPGQWVEFVLPADADALTVRYSIPDAPEGGGITAPLELTANGGAKQKLTLTSEYSWLYNQYPFTNDPNAGLLHTDWWLAECGCVPGDTYEVAKPFRPTHMFAEQRVLFKQQHSAGERIRLTVPTGSNADWTVIDLIDTELVAAPHVERRAVDVTDFGADPKGKQDAAPAIERAIAAAKAKGLPVYLPAGTFRVDRHILVDDVTIIGAGSWHTIVRGTATPLATPAPDGSVTTGVGFYGRDASDGGSTNVHLSGFTIEGDVRERVDTDQVNAIGGAFSDSSITGLYLHRTKVGVWLDGPMSNLTIEDNVIADQIADALNFHGGVTDSVVRNNFIRNTGDDGLAMWSEKLANTGNVFERNTIQTPTLANGIAIYGGADNTVRGNLVADPIREGSGIHVGSRFGAEPFAGRLDIVDNTVVRAGTLDLNWNLGLGAIWFYALDRSIDAEIVVDGDHYLDSTYNAIMLVSDWGVKDRVRVDGVAFRNIRVDGTGTSVLSARVAGSASFENVDARNVGAVGINNCGAFGFPPTGSEFSVADLGGNDGGGTTGPWMASWELPNTITCNDRPPVVTPPAPSTW